MPNMTSRIGRCITDHPKTVLLFFFIITAALAWQTPKFEIDASADTLLTKQNRLYIQSQVLSERFSPEEFLLIAYEPKQHAVISRETLAQVASLSNELEKLPRVESVRSIVNVPLPTLVGGDLMQGTSAEDWTIESNDFDLQQIEKAFQDHPIYEDLIINEGQTATAIQLLFKEQSDLKKLKSDMIQLQQKSLDRELTEEEQETLEQLKQEAEPLEKELNQQRAREIEKIREIIVDYEDQADIYVGGAHVLGYQLINIVRNDLVVFGTAITVMIGLTLLMLFRRFRWVFIPLVCCACSVTATIGLFGILSFKATVISANFIALQLILTLAIVMHLIVQYREYCANNPDWSQKTLIQATLNEKVTPCLYAGITTSIGFASLLLTDIQPVMTFGWMMVIAMAISIVVSLLLFPAVLSLLKRDQPNRQPKIARSVLSVFNTIVLKHGYIPIIGSVLLLLASIVGILRLDVENSFINYFRESTEVHQELKFIDQEFGGSTPLDIIYTLPDSTQRNPDLIVDAEHIQQLQRVQKLLREHEALGKILSIVNFTELAKEINDGKPLTEYELTAIYWSIDEEIRKGLVGSYFSEEHGQLRVNVRVQDATEGLDRAALLEGIKADMERLEIPESQYTITGLFVLYQDILQRLFNSQILALGFVYVLLAAAFLILFRSVKIALIGIVPNVLSTVAILGIMGWLGIPLDLMTITIASIAMGIAVDDTIHYIHRYQKEAQQGDPSAAVTNTLHSVGYAILYTSTIIILGFSLLVFSDFVPGVQFGILTGLAMFMALLFDLTILPVMLKSTSKNQS